MVESKDGIDLGLAGAKFRHYLVAFDVTDGLAAMTVAQGNLRRTHWRLWMSTIGLSSHWRRIQCVHRLDERTENVAELRRRRRA
jgi:hypothetical protein